MKASGSLPKSLYPSLFVIIITMLCMAGVASGAVVAQQLESITNGSWLPDDVAVASDGSLYIVDPPSEKVMIYNASNQQVSWLPVPQPVAVAVGINGSKYVSSYAQPHVKIYDASNVFKGGLLGGRYNEFLFPRNITVDVATGNVYVVDQDLVNNGISDSIKVYTAAGVWVKTISDNGKEPIDAAIYGNELYVLDQPLVSDGSGGYNRGARVAVFDKTSGAYKRSFGVYGWGLGQLNTPRGITVDSQGVFYISDAVHQVIQCFSSTGTYLGAIQNTNAGESMTMPQGLTVSAAGKLYVTTTYTSDPPGLKVFSVNQPFTAGVDLRVSPASLAFGSVNVGSSSASYKVTVTSNGTDNLILGKVQLAGTNKGCFRITSNGCSFQSLAGGASCSVDVKALPNSEGAKSASLSIPSNDPDTPTATVALTVTGVGTPAITATPATLDFGFVNLAEVSAVKTVTIQNVGSTALAITGVATSGFYSNEFKVTADGCTGKSVAPAGNCTVGMTFMPIAEGSRTANLTIQSNDPVKQDTVIIMSGKGFGFPDIQVAPLSIDFGVIPVGTMSASQTVGITNQGTVKLYVGKIAVQGVNPADFLISPNTCSEQYLEAGGTCEINLTFYPAATEGGKTARLAIPSNDPDQSEVVVALKGAASITTQGGVDSNTKNPKGQTRYVVVTIELPTGFSIDEIDAGTVVLNRVNGVEIVPALVVEGSVEVGDYNRNGVPDMIVKFSRQKLLLLLNPGESIITVSGELYDGTLFEQSSRIVVGE